MHMTTIRDRRGCDGPYDGRDDAFVAQHTQSIPFAVFGTFLNKPKSQWH